MKTFKKIIAAIAFILIFVLVFSGLSELFSRKTLEGTWNHTQKISGFYNEPQNEFDIMYFGSSNTYCSFNPLIFFEESGMGNLHIHERSTQNTDTQAHGYGCADVFKRYRILR